MQFITFCNKLVASLTNLVNVFLFNFRETFKSKALLSYKAVDRNKFFVDSDKFNDIDSALGILEKPYELNWPCSREEEVSKTKKEAYIILHSSYKEVSV